MTPTTSPSSLRCPNCLINWPDQATYAKCPICEHTTDRMQAEPFHTEKYAAHLANRYQFDRDYARREDERERQGALTPEQQEHVAVAAAVARGDSLRTIAAGGP